MFLSRQVVPAGSLSSRNRSPARFAPRLLAGATIAFLAGAIIAGPSLAAAPLHLVYRVSHAVIGPVGSYTYSVEALGNGATKVLSREHIDVRMLGIPIYREDTTQTERWQGNRLVSFYGVTDKASGRVEVRGEAEGNRFVITSPQGTSTASATVHPADPCADNFLNSTTILRPDTGGLEEVRVSGGMPASVIIDGVPIAVRKYVVDGKTRYTVWLDSRNLPVMFVVDDHAGQAIFTLAKCVSCDSRVSRPGAE
jgi:Domain of unknown function (DUF6134)